MAPRRKRAAVTPTIAEEEVEVPKVDTPFVAWMKEQEAAGIRKGRLVGVTDHRAPHVTTASATFSPSVDGGGIGTDVDNDNYDGLDAADNVDSDIDTYYDSDGYTGADVVDDTEGGDTPAEEAGSSRKGKRKVAPGRSKKSHWSEEELTEFAAAMWFCKDDFDKMKGKQGAQPWKKLRRVLRDANPKWRRPSDSMMKQWPRLKARMEEIKLADATSGNSLIPKPEWFDFVFNCCFADRAPNPHVVDEGGARTQHAVPGTSTPVVPASVAPNGTQPAPASVGLAAATNEGPNASPARIAVRRRSMESPAYAGHLLVADTMTRIAGERAARQAASMDRLISVLERIAVPPPPVPVAPTQPPVSTPRNPNESPPNRAHFDAHTSAGTPPSHTAWYNPTMQTPFAAPRPAGVPATVQPPMIPPGHDMSTARRLYAGAQPAVAMDSNGNWFFTGSPSGLHGPHAA
ncbi:unnamed protein product [Closterium sp. Naga37s-1]|nr:unnamed protein product [Closterium sp. Naga37s-1]